VAGKMKGIFAIPQTPFVKGKGSFLEVDEESLRREVNFCIEAGAHGIVMPVMASEFTELCEDERKMIAEIVVEETARRIPAVIGVAGVCTRMAVKLAMHAQDVGADAVIAMPPYVSKLSQDGIYEYYAAISDAIKIPIIVQNVGPPLGSSLSPEFVARLIREIRNVKYVKEEVPPEGHSITAVLKACGSDVKGVFGGTGGLYLIEELKRGAAGNMPACAFTDILVEIYNRFEQGDEQGARQLHKEFVPLINLTVGSGSIVKDVLVRRGILRTNYSRSPRTPLDEYDVAELELNLKAMAPYLRKYLPSFRSRPTEQTP